MNTTHTSKTANFCVSKISNSDAIPCISCLEFGGFELHGKYPEFISTSLMKGYWIICCLLLFSLQAQAVEPSSVVYQQSLLLASQGKLDQSIIALQAASAVLPQGDIWRERMLAASLLLTMQKQQLTQLVPLAAIKHNNNYLKLAGAYLQENLRPEAIQIWPAALLASIFPGAGHAWLGRWHDAGVAALFVWPLLLLTLWAARRKMGPVTVFFALLTLWLWSGTVFSAISLAERGSFEMYMQWWQQLWQASALPGRPW